MKKPVGIEPKHYKGMVGEYKKRTVASCICDREIALCMNRLVMIYVMRKMPNQWFDDMDNGQLKMVQIVLLSIGCSSLERVYKTSRSREIYSWLDKL